MDIVKRLARTTDVLVENFRPGVMQRLGLDYPELVGIQPALIYCAISGYGQSGPSARLPAYAPVIHAAGGYDVAHLSYQEGRTKPDNNGIFIADVISGTYAFGAILAAVHQRQRTGHGQLVDVSMLESMLTMTLAEIQRAQFPLPPPGRPMFGPIETRDGYIMLAVASERTFADLARAAGREDWLTDSRFAVYGDRRRNWHLFVEELEQWSRRLTTAECQAAFDGSGVPCSRYRTVEEAMDDPQLAHRHAFGEVRDSAGCFARSTPPSGSRPPEPVFNRTRPPAASTATKSWRRPATRRARSRNIGRAAYWADLHRPARPRASCLGSTSCALHCCRGTAERDHHAR